MQEPVEQPWQWSETTWRGHVDAVRAGRRLVPPQWPGRARVAVALSFDSDHETIPLRDAETSPGKLSPGEYGARVAVPRILRLLGDLGIPASFLVPAVSALLHPDEIGAYVEAGHEVAVHGWIHERNALLERDQELDLTHRAIDTLERLSGRRPSGIRTPSWDVSPHTLDVIRELGFEYDSSLMADDEPYEVLAMGQPPRGALEIWRDEFDEAYADGGLFQLTLHPHVIGHRSRMAVLRELLHHIRGHDGVWFGTHAEVAALAREELISARTATK
jgi:peptidoglycan/xylan/chitin deacetylase (PgdA/CDA1 family)